MHSRGMQGYRSDSICTTVLSLTCPPKSQKVSLQPPTSIFPTTACSVEQWHGRDEQMVKSVKMQGMIERKALSQNATMSCKGQRNGTSRSNLPPHCTTLTSISTAEKISKERTPRFCTSNWYIALLYTVFVCSFRFSQAGENKTKNHTVSCVWQQLVYIISNSYVVYALGATLLSLYEIFSANNRQVRRCCT